MRRGHFDAGFEHMGARARDWLIILADAKFTVTSCARRPLAEFVFHRRFRCRSLDFRSVIGATGWRWRTLSDRRQHLFRILGGKFHLWSAVGKGSRVGYTRAI